MEAQKGQGDPHRSGWRRRQERMRYEVLHMLYRAADASADRQVSAWRFALSLGVWEEEVWNSLVWLQQAGLARIHGAGPAVSITLAGVQYIEHDARRRKTVRGISPPEESEAE